MITKTAAFLTSDKKAHATIEEAQAHEIGNMLHDHAPQITNHPSESVIEFIMNHADKLVDLLTTTKSSKPRARAVNGGTKKRKSAGASTESTNQPELKQ